MKIIDIQMRIKFFLALMSNIVYALFRKFVGVDRYSRKKYLGREIKDMNFANNQIVKMIDSGKPFLVARFGDAELRTLVYTLDIKYGLRREFPGYIKKIMHLNAGFYPCTTNNMKQFGELLWESAQDVDMFGVWFNFMEDYVIHETAPNASLVRLEYLEPYRSSFPWSRALKGKKVLVVHPFADSIRKQYARRELLFNNNDVLPEFYLKVYKAIQTNAGGICKYDSWFLALDRMFEDIQKIDFDIAIIGCGAYGLPLAAKIKKMGKQAIHLGGATQILFGIRGARWDKKIDMQKYFNEYWIRPDISEKPKDAEKVENACYW